MKIFLTYTVLALACLSRVAAAGTLGTLANAFYVMPNYTGGLFCPQTPAPCSGSAAIPGTTAVLHYSSYGVTNYGVLGGYASASTSPGSVTGTAPLYLNVAGGSYFIDTFTFTGTGMCGSTPCAATGAGTIQMQFLVNGTETMTGPRGSSYGGVCMAVNPGNNTNFCASSPGFSATPGVVSLSPPLAITFGQPATFSIGFFAFEHILDYVDPNVSFTADFSHTITLGGFVVDDARGNPLTSFQVSSGTGATYPSTTIPEPSTLVLFGAAMAAGTLSRRLRRRRS